MFKEWTNLNKVIGNATPILDIFRHKPFKQFSIADIEKLLKLSHHPTYRRIKILEKEKILTKQNNKYKINFSNGLVPKILELLAVKEKEEFLLKNMNLNEPLKKLEKISLKTKGIEYIILFGSYATNKTTKYSDVDLFIVIDKKNFKNTKKTIEDTISFIETTYFLRKCIFSPIFATEENVKDMLNNRKEIMRDIIEHGIVIYGENNYYNTLSSMIKEW